MPPRVCCGNRAANAKATDQRVKLYEITDEGRRALADLRREGLSDIWFKFDPFDLALTRLDPERLDDLPSVLAERLDKVQAQLANIRRINEEAREYVGLAKQWALRHIDYRLEAEVKYLTDLLTAAHDIVDDERNPLPRKPKVHDS